MDELLEKSEALHSEFTKVFDYGPSCDKSNRIVSSWLMCSVALEHSVSIRQLMGCGCYTSAMCIIRSQFEALTRAMWLFYAASEEKLDSRITIGQKLTSNADQKPNNAEMINSLDGKASDEAVKMLKEFRDVQWKSLNSYVHAGAHVMLRHGEGYPIELLEEIIKSSNGLLAMNAMMAAILTGDLNIVDDISAIQRRHVDCLPELLPHCV